MADRARGLRQTQCGALFAGKHRKNESLTKGDAEYYFTRNRITESELATNVTVKGQVTLPKAVREAAKFDRATE